MKTTLTQLPKSQVKVAVSLPAKRVEEIANTVIARLAQNIEIKGFRKGRAPKPLVVERAGFNRVQQETVDQALQEVYMFVLKEHKLHPIAQPKVEVKKMSLNPAGSVLEDLEAEFVIDLMPEIKLGDYSKIKIKDKKILESDDKVTDDEVAKVVEHLQRQKSQMKDVERAVKKGDWVEISFKGKHKNVEHEKLQSQNHPLIIGSGAMVPGFEDALIGTKVGENKTIDITFPKDYFAKEFAGEKVKFEITLHKVKEIILPEVDEKFVKEFGLENVEAFKKAIADQLKKEKQERNAQILDSAVIEEARKLMKVDIPAGLLEQEIHRLIHKTQEQIEKQGVDFNRYLESIKKTHEDLHKEFEKQAKDNIEIGFLLGEIIKREKMDVNDSESSKKAVEKLVEIAKKNFK